MDPLLQINKVFFLVMQRERKIQRGTSSSNETVVEDGIGMVNAIELQI